MVRGQAMGQAQQLEELAELLGPGGLDTGDQARRWMAMDAVGSYRLASLTKKVCEPLAVCRPASTEAVVKVVQWANRRQVPLVPRGSGTGVMGGTIPLRPAVVVDMSRMSAVTVHAQDQMVEADAGAILGQINRKLEPHGLMLAHDPWSVAMASVGGAISTNGVGYMAGYYGSMGDQVLGLQGVLANGTLFQSRPYKPATGPDPAAWLIGSQGTLGIVTKAWLRAIPIPDVMRFETIQFGGFEAGYPALLALWRTGLRFQLLDFSDGTPSDLSMPTGLEDESGRTAVIHLGSFGTRMEAEARLKVARKVLCQEGGRLLGPDGAEQYWRHRHDTAEDYARLVHEPRSVEARHQHGRMGLDYINLPLPPGQVVAYRRQALAIVGREPALVAGETGIWCWPELFSLVIQETGTIGTRSPGVHPDTMERVMLALLQLAWSFGGQIECIHGTGLKLLPHWEAGRHPATKAISLLKRAVDPLDLFNPGKLPVHYDAP